MFAREVGVLPTEQLDFTLVWGERHGAETQSVLFVTGPDPDPKQSSDSHKITDCRYTADSSCLSEAVCSLHAP